MNTTIGILAHVDAGKTTLSEQILFQTGVLRKAGRVDHADTLLDYDRTERDRGITIYSGQASFTIGEHRFFLLDTPGHADFAPEMERSLQVLDYAVVIVSCVEGVQAHTRLIWDLLQENKIPTFLFLNKTDRPGADVLRVMQQIRSHLTHSAVLLDDGISSAAEELAVLDDALLEKYLSGGYNENIFLTALRHLIRERELFPCFSGSALTGMGVDRFLAGLDRLAHTQYDPADALSAVVYKVRLDGEKRVVFLKIRSGTLRVKTQIGEEKVHELRQYNGQKYSTVHEVFAGELCGAVGLSLSVGDTIGSGDVLRPARMVPVLRSSVQWSDDTPAQTVLDALRALAVESPELQVECPLGLQNIQISYMGEVQSEVIREALLTRYGIQCTFTEGEILYKETIRAPAYGCGHFEPLRHYAEVHLIANPLPPGSGIRFRSACSADTLRINWQRLIETHVLEKTHVGALCGFPLTDVEFVLLAGRAHEKHTEGGDFRQSTYRAIRNALFHAQSVILEPFYRFRITAPSECTGRILADLETMYAVYDPPEIRMDAVAVEGICPASEIMGYKTVLTAYTRGFGSLSLRFEKYAPCHNEQVVIANHPYDREHDTENTADSVFCAHGAGYTVKWDEAASHMHCEVDKTILEGYNVKK